MSKDRGLTPEQAERETRFFRLLTSETRLLILDRLRREEGMAVADLAAAAGVSVSATSQHLNHLRLGGLVTRTRKAQQIFYSLTDAGREVRLQQAPERAGVLFR